MTAVTDPTPPPEDERRDRPLARFRQLLRRGSPLPPPSACEHLAAAPRDVPVPGGATCEDHGPDDGPVVHLRVCLVCDHVACCDSSRAQHATAHFRASGHAVMQSAEPGESWRWCYIDDELG